MVGLERTFYRVSESVGVVSVCAVVYSPNISCPIQFPFTVALSTLGDTSTLVQIGNHDGRNKTRVYIWIV